MYIFSKGHVRRREKCILNALQTTDIAPYVSTYMNYILRYVCHTHMNRLRSTTPGPWRALTPNEQLIPGINSCSGVTESVGTAHHECTVQVAGLIVLHCHTALQPLVVLHSHLRLSLQSMHSYLNGNNWNVVCSTCTCNSMNRSC